MKSFEDFFREETILSNTEPISIDEIGDLSAKVDSGNDGFNVLHAQNINVEGNKVRFLTVGNKTLVKDLKGSIEVLAGGNKKLRPVIHLDVKVDNQFFKDVSFSLSNREEYPEKVLIGVPFLKQLKALIDVNKPNIIS